MNAPETKTYLVKFYGEKRYRRVRAESMADAKKWAFKIGVIRHIKEAR